MSEPTATNKPDEFTATERIVPFGVPPIPVGVVHVEPSVEVAKGNAVELEKPTATNLPEEFTVAPIIRAAVDEPFIRAGVVHVEPLDEVA